MVRVRPHAECKLCGERRPLLRSHIVPEFVYKELYDSSGRARFLDPLSGRKGKVQKGLRERLLCADCEQWLNDDIEKPYLAMWRKLGLAGRRFRAGDLVPVDFDYGVTKRFLLSVLWRASVSTLPVLRIETGPHSERLRKLLRTGDPGPAHVYPIAAQLALRDDGFLMPCVCTPVQKRILGQRVTVFLFGGVEWAFFTISHRVPHVEKIALRSSGASPVSAGFLRDLHSTSAIRWIQRAVANAGHA